ncbi:MAG: hypothetical protein KBD25_00905 [Rickettsiaceae bacterium]|nr:hypothetical protein [Rickettsiaceae bacterium]
MQDKDNQEHMSAVVDNQKTDIINKKVSFKKDTLRNLVTIASREHFDSKMKQDEMIALTLDKIINSYFEDYWNKNKPNK